VCLGVGVVFVCVCVCVALFVCVGGCVCVCVFLYLFVGVFVCVGVCVYVCNYPPSSALSRPFNLVFLCISIISFLLLTSSLLLSSPPSTISFSLSYAALLRYIIFKCSPEVCGTNKYHPSSTNMKASLSNGSSKGCLTYAHRVVQEMHLPLCATFHGFSFLLRLLSYRYFYLH